LLLLMPVGMGAKVSISSWLFLGFGVVEVWA